MVEAAPAVEQLRAYLRELTPAARMTLLGELERAALRGDSVPAADLVLRELRNSIRASGGSARRAGNPARLFFTPLEPFLISAAAERRQRGRIARTSLAPIWQWISRDLMPAEVRAYCDDITPLLAGDDASLRDRCLHAFHDRAVARIGAALAAVAGDETGRQRLAARIGTPHAIFDASEILAVLKARDALATLALRLPELIRNLADDVLAAIRLALDSPIVRHPDTFPYALVLAMSRLATPWQLVRLGISAADSDLGERIAGTPYGATVAIVLGEIERMVDELRSDLKRGHIAAAESRLRGIHDALRLMRTELDLSGAATWARRLGAVRADMAAAITAEIDALPGRVRRLLRPRAGREAGAGALDMTDVVETEELIGFFVACRAFAGEFAVNEVTLRIHSDLQNFLDTGTPLLLDALRGATGDEHRYRQSQVEAAVRFAGKIFGARYAALIAKAAEVASHRGRTAAVA